MTAFDRCLGSFFGLIVGDSLGLPLEFKTRGSFERLQDYSGGGIWTDDTAMALCLADSLIENKGFCLRSQIDNYMKWYDGDLRYDGGHIDCGITVSQSLRTYRENGDIYAGATDEWSSGNGSIMRLAPVPIFFRDDLNLAMEMSVESSRTTHQSPACLDACRYFGGLIWSALNGYSKEEILSARKPDGGEWRDSLQHDAIRAISDGSFKRIDPPDSSGYVVHTLSAALWAFYYSGSFAEGALMAVNLGGDADSTGAVYGQLAGAYYGFEAIPKHWMQELQSKAMLEQIARDLINL